MADLQSCLIFQRYSDEFERSERVVLDRRNPFDEYDDVKFRQRFRLSKFAVTKLLDKVFYRTYYITYCLTWKIGYFPFAEKRHCHHNDGKH